MMKKVYAAIFVMFLTAMSLNASTDKSDRVGFTVNEVSFAGGFYNDGYKNCPVVMASYLLGRHFNGLFAGCQLGARWLMKTHKVIGFCIEPGISTKGYSETLFKMSFEFN